MRRTRSIPNSRHSIRCTTHGKPATSHQQSVTSPKPKLHGRGNNPELLKRKNLRRVTVWKRFRFRVSLQTERFVHPARVIRPSPSFINPESRALFGLLDKGQELAVERDHDSILSLRALDLRAPRDTGCNSQRKRRIRNVVALSTR